MNSKAFGRKYRGLFKVISRKFGGETEENKA
jgi:hypothetical protein